MFFLSHHHPDELHRAYRIAGVHVCARCLGTYPVLLLALGWQFSHRVPLERPSDLPLVLGLSAPAVLDWAIGRFRPELFSNAWRTATGVLLGIALGRTLYTHLQRPLPPSLLGLAALVTAVGVPVILLSARQR